MRSRDWETRRGKDLLRDTETEHRSRPTASIGYQHMQRATTHSSPVIASIVTFYCIITSYRPGTTPLHSSSGALFSPGTPYAVNSHLTSHLTRYPNSGPTSV